MVKKASPYFFDDFFASGLSESVSPFLTKSSRSWGKHLPMMRAIIGAFLWVIAFTFSFTHQEFSFLFIPIIYFLCGIPSLVSAIDDLKNLEININILMTAAAFLALFLGSALEGALLFVLFDLSSSMEHMVTQKAKNSLHNLNQLRPMLAYVIKPDGLLIETFVKDIEIGTHILIKAGEVVPLDGNVIAGQSAVNLVHLTGESLPVVKKKGDEVPSGASTIDGSLTLEVTRISGDSTISKIIQLISNAQETKSTSQRWLDVFGKRYTFAIFAITIALALSLPFIFSISYFGKEGAIYRSLAFLIAASPCALIIATPTTYLSAISSCAKKGIILKGGAILDVLSHCSILALDKTGTITEGNLQCTNIEALDSNSRYSIDQALTFAASLETHSSHPIATAICTFAKTKKLPIRKIEDFVSKPGFGLQGKIDNASVLIGLPDFILSSFPEKNKQIESIKNAANQTITLCSIEGSLFLFYFEDPIREDSFSLIKKILTNKHLAPIMLTGDNLKSATVVANKLNIKEIYADLRPEDKLSHIANLSKKTGLIMVGDGINDAPALARATVGISMGKIGSKTAIDASDVILYNDDLGLIHWLYEKAKKTTKILKQNFILALFIICFASIPALLGIVPLWLAVTLHEGGTLLVGCNSLRLLKQ